MEYQLMEDIKSKNKKKGDKLTKEDVDSLDFIEISKVKRIFKYKYKVPVNPESTGELYWEGGKLIDKSYKPKYIPSVYDNIELVYDDNNNLTHFIIETDELLKEKDAEEITFKPINKLPDKE